MDNPLPTYVIASTEDAADSLKTLKIPVVGTIYPLPDPVYGHTFKMPAIKATVGSQQTQDGKEIS